MAKTPTLAIQTAVYALLSGDATLSGLVTGVFDEVPEGTAYPYVVVGEAFETPDNSHDRHGRRTTETIHVWSDHQGFSEAVEIADRVVELLDHQTLAVSGFHHVTTRFDFMQTLRDPDLDIRHVPVRFVVVTEENTI